MDGTTIRRELNCGNHLKQNSTQLLPSSFSKFYITNCMEKAKIYALSCSVIVIIVTLANVMAPAKWAV